MAGSVRQWAAAVAATAAQAGRQAGGEYGLSGRVGLLVCGGSHVWASVQLLACPG